MGKKQGNSSVLNMGKAIKKLTSLVRKFIRDGVTVYAAQAAFYTIISSIPFLMLLISLSKYIIPEAVNALFRTLRQIIPEKFSELFTAIYNEVNSRSDIPIVPLTAITTLWSSSRSISAIIKGISFIYDAENYPGAVKNLFYSLVYTIVFVFLIIAALLVLVFGSTLRNIFIYRYPKLEGVFSTILDFRSLIFFIVLTVFFSLMYFAVSKSIIKPSGTLRIYRSQLPGALFASAGWMLFSYFFSLYLKFYPSASYIYGSLATVMLMMLWLYFCMVILLAGAEINKLLSK